MHWHFRQPELSLFWFAKGAERLRSDRSTDFRQLYVSRKIAARHFPAANRDRGEWNVGPTLDNRRLLNPSFGW